VKTKLFSLIKNKSFIGGFFAGVFITTVAAIVLFSFNSPTPNTKHLKGTMSGSNIAVGMTGVVVGLYGTTSGPCPLNPSNVCDVGEYAVEFPGENPIMCFGNPNYPISQQVVISSTTLPGPVNVYVMPN
jgi:hypothetical protein